MKTILAPIDFSSMTRRVIAESGRLAKAGKARVVLLHVTPPAQAPTLASAYSGIGSIIEVDPEADQRGIDRHLAKLRSRFLKKGIPAEAECVSGNPATCIVQGAAKHSADFIVLGSRGHAPLYNLLMGGTAIEVIRKASCPVMVMPASTNSAS